MENLTFLHRHLFELRFYLKMGWSFRRSLVECLERHDDSVSCEVKKIIFMMDHGHDWRGYQGQMPCPFMRTFIDIVQAGCSGIPIYEKICCVEKAVEDQLSDRLESDLQSLPIKSMLPILFIMFPSYLILLFGPLLKNMIGGLI